MGIVDLASLSRPSERWVQWALVPARGRIYAAVVHTWVIQKRWSNGPAAVRRNSSINASPIPAVTFLMPKAHGEIVEFASRSGFTFFKTKKCSSRCRGSVTW